jgi:hypothetical protein
LCLSIETFHGSPTIYVNFDKLPEKIEDSLYIFDKRFDDSRLEITPSMWKAHNPKTKNIFITFANSTTTFSIYSYFRSSVVQYLFNGDTNAIDLEATEFQTF